MNKKSCLLPLLALLPAFVSHAGGGISLGATRVIYPADASQASVSIRNSSTADPYLIQSWITDAAGQKSRDFIITPPLFVINGGKENTLRLEMVGKPAWPADRETLYYLNSKAIPSSSPATGSANTLQIATQTVIKMFIRPKGLNSVPDDAPGSLSCHFTGTGVDITNPSPYYVTLVNLSAGKQSVHSTMVAPKSKASVKFSAPVSSLTFQSVNDYGSMTPVQTCKTL